MAHTCRNLIAGVGSLAVLVCSVANAADQGVTGKKLLLRSSGKVVLLSKDPGISIGGSDPVGGTDSSVSFDDGSTLAPLSLPKTLWSANGSATLFKYRNPSAPGGPSSVKIAKVKSGLLKIVAKGLPFAVPNGSASIDVVLSLDGGTNTYCMTFSGTGDGSKFLAKDAPAGSCAECGNDVQDEGEACDGMDDAICPGNCLPDCTCNTCGNNVLDGAEVCDGTADAACPNECLPDCTCAAACPTGGSALACNQNVFSSECEACCDSVLACDLACISAGLELCADDTLNDACSTAVTAAGCAAECCPS